MTTITVAGMPGHSRRASRRRLLACLLLSAAIVLAMLQFAELPFDGSSQRVADRAIEVDLSQPEPLTNDPDTEMPEPADIATSASGEQSVVEEALAKDAAPEGETAVAEDVASTRPVIDWHVAMLKAAAAAATVTTKHRRFTGDFDEKLEAAAARYYASPDHGPRPIWENVEKDQLGRTLLWHGDCYRVLADPNVMNLYVFETFTQHLVFCQTPHDVAQELPWVKEFIARYPHLR
ncbi:MAG: hypothetical protein KJO31_02380 [Gammaproteobacteria bacterium]|nr:hypothetical protein [Gammaproteobacteria bacterium]